MVIADERTLASDFAVREVGDISVKLFGYSYEQKLTGNNRAVFDSVLIYRLAVYDIGFVFLAVVVDVSPQAILLKSSSF